MAAFLLSLIPTRCATAIATPCFPSIFPPAKILPMPDLAADFTHTIRITSKSGRYGGTYAHRDITFEFASWISSEFELYLIVKYQFADKANRKITHLENFAATFLVKCTLGQTISRYMVLIASEQKFLMMRLYQIYQVKTIVQCIHDNCGNGFIWSTTDSGKTLTLFKASTVLKDNPDIVKCLFVVDRKDLDHQAREDWSSSDKTSSKGDARRVSGGNASKFNKFQEDCGEENTNTGDAKRGFCARTVFKNIHAIAA